MDFCKVCGGPIARIGDVNVCEKCNTIWADEQVDEKGKNERDLAWKALNSNDFETATTLFDKLIFCENASHEAFWGKALSEYGVEYVTDLDENKKVPTCNNLTDNSFLENEYVKKAISIAPKEVAESYKDQANKIESIRVEWVEKASQEPAYDIFISYKESDRVNNIARTQDSYDVQDLYNMLTKNGYNVFYSRISLTSHSGEKYEPYIYNAIKTAKVMIVFGEKPEYFTSPWIKNEWRRYITRIEHGEKQKDSLIVLYKNMNPGDLPAVLACRQSVDFSRVDAVIQMFEHIDKVINQCGGTTAEQEKKQNELSPEYMELLKELQEKKERERQGIAEQERGLIDEFLKKIKRDFVCDISNNEITLTRYKGAEREIVITPNIHSYTIKKIADGCFKGCESLRSVTIGEGVEVIGNNAFERCKYLSQIKLPNTLTSIGNFAFAECIRLKEVKIPDGVKTVGNYAFAECTSLYTVSLSQKTKTGKDVFVFCPCERKVKFKRFFGKFKKDASSKKVKPAKKDKTVEQVQKTEQIEKTNEQPVEKPENKQSN